MISDGRNILMNGGLNADVLKNEIACYQQFKDQPAELVSDLTGLSVDEQCQSIFNYLITNVSYKLDADGCQFIKSPARLLHDQNGDCKSLTMFLCCCLHCLHVTHKFRFVNFDGSDQYTHVYAVAVDENGNEIILDACETDPRTNIPIYDYARPFVKKKDFTFYE